MANEITVTANTEIRARRGFMDVSNFEEALKVAEILAKSDLCPTAFKGKPADVLIALQKGSEIGLMPMQSLDAICVINGKPTVYGDAMLALCRFARNFEYIDETFDERSMTAICKAKRRGEPEVVRTFSKADAEVAQLWMKNQVWKQYGKRMLQMRARGFCLRDAFPDVLKGIISEEEARDYPEPVNVSPRSAEDKATNVKREPIIEDAVFTESTVSDDIPFANSEIDDIEMVLRECASIEELREKTAEFRDSYKNEEMRKKVVAISTKIYEEKFKK